MALSPKSEALAFRIWALCEPEGWGLTLQEVADGLGEEMRRVQSVVNLKKWSGRLRHASAAPKTKAKIGVFGVTSANFSDDDLNDLFGSPAVAA